MLPPRCLARGAQSRAEGAAIISLSGAPIRCVGGGLTARSRFDIIKTAKRAAHGAGRFVNKLLKECDYG